ncbi:MAG TPA: GNAT family N-acetyltransferase [candidate division Zixibacteria bacterium]|nr:GNAT family N-acetyltransferase [candidate division Zixibacteria bacterium]
MRGRNRSARGIRVREMRVDDIPAVYRLGRRLFKNNDASTFYRTWDAYEVTNNFNQDPHLSLVAEARRGSLVGFALGTTYGDESGGWKYGYVLWIGVRPSRQNTGVGALLYQEMERRMHRDGVRMVFVDVARSNTAAIRFFKRVGFGKPETELWMSKLLQRSRKNKNAERPAASSRSRRAASRPASR